MIGVLISKTVQVRWIGNIRKHYEKKGYGEYRHLEFFEVKVEDLMHTSTIKVEVKCDYCEDGVSVKPYRDYLQSRAIVEKDCCKKRSCMVQKSEESNLVTYGVRSISQTEKRKEEARKMFQTPKEDVISVAKSKGIKILNIEDYQNDRTRLNVICERHSKEGIQKTNYANIKKNKHCCIYINKEIVKGVPKIDGEQVVEEFKSKNLIPAFKAEDYLSNNSPLPYICPSHKEEGIQYRSRSNLIYTRGCSHCVNERRSDAHRASEEDILNHFNSKGIVPVDITQYRNRESRMEFICPVHKDNIQETTVGSLRGTKTPCKYCRVENSLTSLNRMLRSSIGEWRARSEKNCNYRCVLTNSSVYNVHHVNTFNNIIIDSLEYLDITVKAEYTSEEIIAVKEEVVRRHSDVLGVCIHPFLHIEFHKIFGKENNNMCQFKEFKKLYETGEFDDLLEMRSGESND